MSPDILRLNIRGLSEETSIKPFESFGPYTCPPVDYEPRIRDEDHLHPPTRSANVTTNHLINGQVPIITFLVSLPAVALPSIYVVHHAVRANNLPVRFFLSLTRSLGSPPPPKKMNKSYVKIFANLNKKRIL